MESEAISIDEYLDSDVEQRFDFLYENYSVLKAIIKDYREDIINDVIEMKSFKEISLTGWIYMPRARLLSMIPLIATSQLSSER